MSERIRRGAAADGDAACGMRAAAVGAERPWSLSRGARYGSILLSCIVTASIAMPGVPAEAFADGQDGLRAAEQRDIAVGGDEQPADLASEKSDLGQEDVAGEGSGSESGAGAPSGSGGADAPAEQPQARTLSFSGDIVVPYGVDVASWLSRDDVKPFRDEDGAALSVSEAASYFAEGSAALSYVGASYPDPGASLAGALALGEPADGVTLPDASAAPFTMAKVDVDPDDGVEADAVPLIPDAAAASLSLSDDAGDAAWRIAGSWAQGTTRLWLSATGGDVSVSCDASADVAALSPTLDAKADGSFASTEAGQGFVATGAATAFAKLSRDMTFPDASGAAVTLYAGQVVRIPVGFDETAPSISDMKAMTDAGDDIDLANAWVQDGALSVGSAGINVSCAVEDPAPEGATPAEKAESTSGVDASTLFIEPVGGDGPRIAASSFADGRATFELSMETLGGAGVYDLSDFQVVAADVARNGANAALSAAEPFASAGIGSLEIVDESAAENRPVAELSVANAKKGDDGVYYNGSAQTAAELAFRVHDPRFDELSGKQSWLDSDPIAYTVNGVRTPLDPKGFSSTGVADSYRSGETPTLPDEGRYSVEYSYTGATRYFLGFIPVGAFKSSDSATLVVDRTAPQATGIAIDGGFDEATELARGADDGRDVLIGPARTLAIDVADVYAGSLSGEAAAASGIVSASVNVVRHQQLDGSDAGVSETEEFSAAELSDGTLSIALSDDGVYRLGDISITMSDKAGNSHTATASDIVAGLSADQAASWTFVAIVVDAKSSPASGVDVESSVDARDRAGVAVHGSDTTAALWVADEPWMRLYAATDSFADGIAATYEPADAEGASQPSVETEALSFSAERDRWEIPVTLPSSADGTGALDGSYELSFRYRAADASDDSDNDASFIVDSAAPVASDASVGDVDEARDIAEVDGGRLLVGGPRELRIRVQDLLAADQTLDADRRDAAHTSGVQASASHEGAPSGDSVVTVELACADSLAPGAPASPLDPVVCTVDGDGWLTLPLSREGVYDLSDIAVVARDNAGNESRTTLSDIAKAVAERDPSAAWGFTRILVDDPAVGERSASVSVADAAETPASADASGYYHRGATDVSVEVRDPWFAAWASIPARQEGFFSISCTDDEGAAREPGELASLTPGDFSYDAEAGAWKASVAIDGSAAGLERPIQGDYDVRVRYAGVSGADADVKEAGASFGIDWEAPTFGPLSLSATEPLVWGWIFPHDEETASIPVSDNLSGPDAATGTIEQAGIDTPPATFEGGVLSTTLTDDAARMLFGAAHASMADVAGNVAVTSAFSDYKPSNVPEGAIGASVDDAAPAISVAYDNNDVRNGRYYAANRTATIEVEEANFDLIKANDPERTVATVSRDGSEQKIEAKAFENPSGDGKTWVASWDFDEDGDWSIDVSLTDPAGRQAEPFHDEFTIDTTEPQLMVEFDNNDAANGMYYKAPRTATVTVFERNFDPSLAGVSTTAANGAAPQASGWVAGDSEGEWKTTVHFGAETHYTLTASCTDLAGNAAENFEEPEFVIDLTPPSVSIGGVADHVAYADAVAPSIAYSDVNFDPLMADYVLSGAAQGDVYLMNVGETEGEGSKQVQFPDFEHTVESDDVYTLTATVHDLADNEAQASVTFSVNRYGSNYVLEDGGESMLGAYLSAPRDVVVKEINVSGLDTSLSHAEVVRDSRAESLSAGDDYEVSAGDQGGWSETTYTFPARLFESDGYYRVLLTSVDAAGNLSQNMMDAKNASRDAAADISFAVDSTSPVAGLDGVESGGVYLQPQREVGADVRDNLAIERASILVDGEERANFDASALSSEYATWNLPADGEPHTVTLSAVDKAGNEVRVVYDDVVIAGDWIAYIRNTPELLYGSVAAIIALLAGAAGSAALIVRHRRATAHRRNPFGRGA